jgi:hypothetical protein
MLSTQKKRNSTNKNFAVNGLDLKIGKWMIEKVVKYILIEKNVMKKRRKIYAVKIQ